MTVITLILALVGLFAGMPLAWGQAGTPGIDARQANQERRIDQSVVSGQLTPREAARLDRNENRIDRMENRAKADGVVTPRERARLHGALDQQSKAIARQKHDRQRAR